MNITKKVKRITLGILGTAILASGLWACSNDDTKEIKKQENNLETLKKDLLEVNKKNNTNSNTTYGNGKPIDKWSIVAHDGVGLVAGGRIGKFFGPWGAGIGMVAGAALVSYSDYVDQKRTTSVTAPNNYELGKIEYVAFDDKIENIGIGHNVYLNQLVREERVNNDFIFDERVSKYFINYNDVYNEEVATNVNSALNVLYVDIQDKGIDTTINPILNDGSLLVKETIMSFNQALLKCSDFNNCIELIQNYKSYIDNSDLYNQEEKNELMAFLVVIKYSAHYWTSAN